MDGHLTASLEQRTLCGVLTDLALSIDSDAALVDTHSGWHCTCRSEGSRLRGWHCRRARAMESRW